MKQKDTNKLTRAAMLLLAMLFSFTARAQQALPYSYGFENNNLSADGWVLQGATSSSTGINGNAAQSGSYGFMFQYSEQSAYLLSPIFTGGDNGIDVSFFYKEYSSAYGHEQFQVGYTTDASVTDAAAFIYGNMVTASTSWQEYTQTFPAGTKRIAIKYVYNDAFYLYLDDFTFLGNPAPQNLAVSPAATKATVTWEGNANSYNVRFKKLGFYENFENGFDNWTIYTKGEHIDGYSGWVTMQTGGSYAACAFSWYENAFNADNWLISPAVDLQGTLSYLAFSGYGDQYEVLLSTTGTDIEDFTIVLKAMGTAPTDWTEETIDLSSYTGQGYIAFHHVSENCFYLGIDDIKIVLGDWTTNSTTETSAVLTGLNPETIYEVQVQAVYADDKSEWVSTTFTTPSDTDAPIDLIASDITASQATLSWTGSQNIYNVQYRTATIIGDDVLFSEDFEGLSDGALPAGWTSIDYDGDGFDWVSHTNTGSGNYTTHAGDGCMTSGSYDSDSGSPLTPDNWLITPQIALDGFMSAWFVGQDANYAEEHFAIYVSTTGNSVADFTTQIVGESVATGEYVEYTADLTSYAGQQGYIAIRHFNVTDMFYLNLDDFTIYGVAAPAGDWVSATVTEETLALTDLIPNTKYEWQVQGNLTEGTTEWSEMSSFTTLEAAASVTIGATGYATFVAPSDVSFPSDVTAFIITAMTGTSVTMEAVEAIPAGTAVVVKGAAGTYYLDAAASTDDVTSNLLKACTSAFNPAAENSIYCLANKDKGVGFYPVATTVTIPAGKAYLEITSKAKAFYALFEDDATAIENVNVNDNLNGAIYNVAGQRLNKAQKGINIVNGKKILK